MVTLREYAAKWDISYEAVRRQVARCSEELEGHIVINGKVKYLDSEAVRILDSKRATNVVRVYDHIPEDDHQLKEAEQKNNALMEKITELSTSIASHKEKIEELKDIIIEKDNKIIELQNLIITMQQSAAADPDESKEEEQLDNTPQEEHEEAQNSSDQQQNVPDQEEPEAEEDQEQKEGVNIDTQQGTASHDDSTHEREPVADPVQNAAVPEEKEVPEEENKGEKSVVKDTSGQDPVREDQKKTGLLHKILSIWKK